MKSDEEILNELKQATTGLLFMSESDYPFEIVRWEGVSEVTASFLRSLAQPPEDAQVQVQSVEDFFRAATSEDGWKGAEELATARKYQNVVRLLKENLADVRVYRLGEINVAVYIMGKSSTGNRLGLSTRVVET